jgi:hypothetical protein
LWISTNSSSWGDDFIQTADIDASPTFTWNGGSGFRPIGNSTTQFTGSYDGQNFIIDGIVINYPSSDNIGFFGYISNAEIQDLGLTNMNVFGSIFVGALCGNVENSIIKSCCATGFVTANVIGGGLIGLNNGSISGSYANVAVSFPEYAGGLVGRNNGVISNSYAFGNVKGEATAGGFVGDNFGIIENSYSIGNVESSFEIGGFAAQNNNTIKNSFWDIETSGLISGIPSNGLTGKTTLEMKNVNTFTNLLSAGLVNPWDFLNNPNDDTGNEDIWNIDLTGVKNDGYPYLSWQGFEDDNPLPVVLSSFAAIQTSNNFAQINWTTQSETNLLGYNLYRNTENTNSGSQKINSQMIYAENSSIGSNYSYTDETVEYEQPYYYWLESVELSGNTELFGPVSMTLENPENNAPELPNMTILKQNYPNPFNPSTIIEFSIKENETGKLSIFNVKGQLIENKEFQTGVHSYHWNAEKFSSGMYFYRLQTQSVSQIKKMMMMK